MRGTRKLTFFIPNKFNCDWNLAIKTALLREIRLDEFSLLCGNDLKMTFWCFQFPKKTMQKFDEFLP